MTTPSLSATSPVAVVMTKVPTNPSTYKFRISDKTTGDEYQVEITLPPGMAKTSHLASLLSTVRVQRLADAIFDDGFSGADQISFEFSASSSADTIHTTTSTPVTQKTTPESYRELNEFRRIFYPSPSSIKKTKRPTSPPPKVSSGQSLTGHSSNSSRSSASSDSDSDSVSSSRRVLTTPPATSAPKTASSFLQELTRSNPGNSQRKSPTKASPTPRHISTSLPENFLQPILHPRHADPSSSFGSIATVDEDLLGSGALVNSFSSLSQSLPKLNLSDGQKSVNFIELEEQEFSLIGLNGEELAGSDSSS